MPAKPATPSRETERGRAPEMEASRQAAGEPPAVSVEALLYVGIALVGLAVRLVQLDAWPLSAAESQTALAAWLIGQGYRPDTSGLSSLLVYATTLGFVPLAAGDGTARLAPALIGALMVGLPWFLRDRLGRALST
jgi:predicted membrane-bound mannosyltransferase